MQEKFMALGLGEKLVLGGAVILLIASFLNWAEASISFAGFSESDGGSGWASPGSIWGILAILIAVALAALLVAMKFGNFAAPALPTGISWGMVYAAGAALVIVFMLLKAWRIMELPGCGDAGDLGDLGVGDFDCSIGFAFGYFVALVGAIIFAAGGFLMYSTDKGAGFEGLRSRPQ